MAMFTLELLTVRLLGDLDLMDSAGREETVQHRYVNLRYQTQMKERKSLLKTIKVHLFSGG